MGEVVVDGGRLTDHLDLGVLASCYPRDLLEECLEVTGRKEKRSRLLPAHVVMRYTIACGLHTAEAGEEVMRRLSGSLRELDSWQQSWQVPSTSAIAQARSRLGAAPLVELFERACVPMARQGTKGAWLRGWRLMTIDGSTVDVADTPENSVHFGRSGRSGVQAAAFPQLRAVVLAECGTHAVVAAALGGYRDAERTLAHEVVPAATQGMLLLADTGFYGWELWQRAQAGGAELAWRMGASVELPLIAPLGDGSYLSLLFNSNQRPEQRRHLLEAARAGHPVPAHRAQLVRVVEYTVPGANPDGELICLATTVTDPELLPAAELAAAYHERWENEEVFKELKTRLLTPGRPLRSKTPEMVSAEVYGLFLAHYAVRSLIQQAADEDGHDVDRLSFTRCVRIARRHVTGGAFPP